MKRIGFKPLFDSGLIFEINRSILHPLGYALVYKPGVTPDDQDALLLYQTTDDEGMLYMEENFMDGAAKFAVYMKNIGEKLLQKRMNIRGFIRQTRSDQ